MPQALAFIVLAAQAGSLSGVLAGIGAIFTGTAVGQIALSIGLSLLSSLIFKPKQPKPDDVQSSVKNPTAARIRHYGRVKISGPWVFAESIEGAFHKVVALGTGELDAIEEYWIDDNLVTIDGSGLVIEDKYRGKASIFSRLGLAAETVYSNLTGVFPEWDASHIGNGVSSLYAIQRPMGAQYISSIFPNITNTLYRVVARGSKVFNPSTGTTIWSDNAAAIIRDYMTHQDGMRLPASLFSTTQAATGWLAAYNRAATAVPIKAGGTENAYRLWGSYGLDERPADVLGRMMQCSDSRIIPTPDGGITLDIGTWAEPTVTIDSDSIVGFSDVSRGHDALSTANVISATFLSPTHDYQATDADRWIDEDDVAARGEIVSDQSFNMVPSHGQTRRLMKLAAYRAKPNWSGQFQCNLRALAAFGERFIRITYAPFGIDEVFEVVDFRFDIGEGGILQGVTLQVQSMPQAAYNWDAATEEGTEPISEETVVDDTIPVPTGLTVIAQSITVGGVNGNYAVLTFDASPSDALVIQAQGRLTTDSAWTVVGVETGATTATGFIISDGGTYEFQLRFVTLTGRQGAWSASVTITADGIFWDGGATMAFDDGMLIAWG